MFDAGRPPSVHLRGYSYIAYTLTPELPITQWLTELDETIDCSAEFPVGKSIVLDLSKVTPSQTGVAHLIAELQTRNIRIMGIEGVSELGPELPPVLRGGRTLAQMERLDRAPAAPPAGRDGWPTRRTVSSIRTTGQDAARW
jgi:septum site-determining protein MinC